MDYFSGHCRRGTIADGYAGPAQLPPADAPYDPDDTGGDILGRALPDHYTPDEIQLLTIAIAALAVSYLDRDSAYRRRGLQL